MKRGKTDAADAEAIYEAVTRPTMRFVAVISVNQQAALMLHKTRDLQVRQRTMLINGLRGHLAEFVIIAAKGPSGVKAVTEALHEAQDRLPELVHLALHGIVVQLRQLEAEIERLQKHTLAWHRVNDVSRRLATFGPITASAIAAAVPDDTMFHAGRRFAAWLGLTPKAHSSGGKERQVGISNQGDGYLRRSLVVDATAVMQLARKGNARRSWTAKLLERKPAKLAAVALASKTARIAWVVMMRE